MISSRKRPSPWRTALRCVGLLVAVATAAAACGNNGPALPDPAEIVADAGTDGQVGFGGTPVARPLAVQVTSSDARPVPRAVVLWTSVGDADPVPSDRSTVTDGNGRAEVWVTLDGSIGEQQIRAVLDAARDRSVTFTLTAVAAPSLTAIEPDVFVGGDTVDIVGANLEDTLAVEIAGARAEVLGATNAGDRLTVKVPPCLAAGSVEVRVLMPFGKSEPVTGTAVASTSPLALEPGDYVAVEPETVMGCAVFPPADANGAQFLIAPQATTGVPGLSTEYRLGSGPVTATRAVQEATTPRAERFDAFLRQREAIFAEAATPIGAQPSQVAAQIDQGDRREFRVCSIVTCMDQEDFVPVTATAEFVGKHATIYVDVDAPDSIAAQDLTELGRLFDEELYPVATNAFGVESDIDANGHVLILLTPVVNGLTPAEECESSIITGFFFAIDISPQFQDDARSNQGEVFYGLTPDASGEYGCSHALQQVLRLVPVTFSHEIQHMISYNQHVLLRDGSSEQLWLNEGMSHLSEELAALHFESIGELDRFSQFAIGDLFDAFLYLKDPGDHFVIPSEGTGTLEERGASWLFLRWVLDQYGSDMVRRLSETANVGAANVAAVTGEPFGRIIGEWFVANWVSDNPDLDLPAGSLGKVDRLQYRTWDFRALYAELHTQLPSRFDRPFPTVPLEFTGGVFAIENTLRAGSGDYVLVTQSPNAQGFALEFSRPDGTPLEALARARLNVMRLR
jgi:hypothetical protein